MEIYQLFLFDLLEWTSINETSKIGKVDQSYGTEGVLSNYL